MTKAYEYAKWCIDPQNEKIGEYVKKQCSAWIDIVDGKKDDVWFDLKMHKK